MGNINRFAIIFSLVCLTSCGAYLNQNQNPYYFGMTVFDSQKLKKPKDVKIYNLTENNLEYFIKKGYKIKAKSAFRETYVHMDWAKLASKQLGTPIMLLKDDYVGSVSGRKTLEFRIPGEKYIITSNTNSNLNYSSNTEAYAIGNNGYAMGSSTTNGNSKFNSTTKTTIQGPDQYSFKTVPYETHYYDYFAIFLVKDSNVEEKTKVQKILPSSEKVGVGLAIVNTKYNVLYDISSYADKDFEIENGIVRKNSSIKILEVGGNYYKIEHMKKIKYIYSGISLGK